MKLAGVAVRLLGAVGLMFGLGQAHAELLRLDFSSELHRSTGQFSTEYVTSIDGWLSIDTDAPLISSSDGGVGKGSSSVALNTLEFEAFGSLFKNTGGQRGVVITEADSSYCMVDGIACYRDMVKFWVWDPQPEPMKGVTVASFNLEIFGYDMLEDGDRPPSDLSFLSRAKYARILLMKEGDQGIWVGSPEQANVTAHVNAVPEPSTAALAALAMVAVGVGKARRRRVCRNATLDPSTP